MNIKKIIKTTLLLVLFSFTNCDSEESINEEQNERKLVGHYYFKGVLGDEPLLIEEKYYDDGYPDDQPFSMNNGGTLINCVNYPENGIANDCYTIYSCGITVDEYNYPEEVNKHNGARLTFGEIDVETREFDIELEAFRNFLKNKELKFRRVFGDVTSSGDFSLDIFPPNPDKNDLFYYSTRFNDNSEYIAKISFIEENTDNHRFVIEGYIDECKLYDSRDKTQYKTLTDLKFKVLINANFNYNNYKD